MSYSLVILGLLMEKPRHAYEIKQMIQLQGMDQYIRLSGGGLHYHLGKLLQPGYIELEETNREGNYPERQVYRITHLGRDYFLEQLRETLVDVEARRQYDPLDAALVFAGSLPLPEVIAYIEYQAYLYRTIATRLRLIRNFTQSLEKNQVSYVEWVIDHSIHRKESEIAWLEKVASQLKFQKVVPPNDSALQAFPSQEAWLKLEPMLRTAEKICQSKMLSAWNEYKYTAPEHHFEQGTPAQKRYEKVVEEALADYERTLLEYQKQPVQQ